MHQTQLKPTQLGGTSLEITRDGFGSLATGGGGGGGGGGWEFGRVAARYDTTPGAAAAAWTPRHPAVHGAIIGFRTNDQVDAVLDAGRLELSDPDVAKIEDAGRTAVPA